MIDRQHGEIVYECDSCTETLETCEPDWNDAKRQFDDAGWRAYKAGADWVHECPKCGARS